MQSLPPTLSASDKSRPQAKADDYYDSVGTTRVALKSDTGKSGSNQVEIATG